MGWSDEQCARVAPPAYPFLIDERHLVAELYNMTNVPMAVWINEAGRIVRPAEPAGASDGFRAMDRATFTMPSEVAARGRVARQAYVDALTDWVAKGEASPYALTAGEVSAQLEAPSNNEALGTANFRLGQYLRAQGYPADAQTYFEKARRLCPQSWHFVRQALELEQVGKASGPEFFAAVDSLGERAYYPAVQLTTRSR
jgi:hypothetical protein